METTAAPSIDVRLMQITEELREVEALLEKTDDIEARLLTDFRDAVNRVRTTAWALQQYASCKATEHDSGGLMALLAGERIRLAYQVCRLVQADLANPDIAFQKGPLLQLYLATQELVTRLATTAAG